MIHSQTGLPIIKRPHKRPRELSLKTPRRLQVSLRSPDESPMLMPNTPNSPQIAYQSLQTIETTNRKIDALLDQLSSKIRHANYLEETKHSYIHRMEQMEREITELKTLIKLREMDPHDKEIIDRLTARNAEIKRQSDLLFNSLHNYKKKAADLNKAVEELSKQNQRLQEENKNISKKLLAVIKKPTGMDLSFGQALDRFLDSGIAKTTRLYKFMLEHRQLSPLQLLCEMTLFSEVPIKSHGTSPVAKKQSNKLQSNSRLKTDHSIS